MWQPLQHHYRCKSLEENVDERAQGRANKGINHVRNAECLEQAKAVQNAPNGTVFGNRAWLAVKKHLPHYAAYDVLAVKNYRNCGEDHMAANRGDRQQHQLRQ
mmetsp:Transcript_50239/g.75009  ORF Transcript_50239/g.75009 Transcript_50239/m.75009 type:complete len:103 (-) Transcript_50239:77-385(-)